MKVSHEDLLVLLRQPLPPGFGETSCGPGAILRAGMWGNKCLGNKIVLQEKGDKMARGQE